MLHDYHRRADAALAAGDVTAAMAALEAGLATGSDDVQGWMKLAALRRGAGDGGGALAAVNAALQAQPFDFLALMMKGGLQEQAGGIAAAAEVYRAALFHAPAATALPPAVNAQLDRIRRGLEQHRAEAHAHLAASAALDPEHQARARRLVDNVLARRPVFHQEPTHYRYPGLGDVEFFDFAYAEFRSRLRAAAADIAAEFHALAGRHADRQSPYVDFAPGEPVGQWAALNRSPAWNAFHLIRYGEQDPVNAAACPRTLAAFAGPEQAVIPGLGANLMFSLLAPRTHIPPHHGVANFRVVCHLPIAIPPGCRFRVGGDTRPWVAGEPWIFDDTIEHEAWNDSDALRVVLIGDLWRPELDAQDRLAVRRFMEAQDGVSGLGAL